MLWFDALRTTNVATDCGVRLCIRSPKIIYLSFFCRLFIIFAAQHGNMVGTLKNETSLSLFFQTQMSYLAMAVPQMNGGNGPLK